MTRLTRQPSSTAPTRWLSFTRTSVKNTSLKPDPPLIWWIGFTSMPGSCMSTQNMVRPLCFGASGLVRVTTMPKSENWAPVVHTFWPEMIQSPEPSGARTALVRAAATSDPPEGSENSWHQISSPRRAGPTKRFLVSSSQKVITVGTHMPRPIWNGFPGTG